jgi:5-deoxy-glucuronate isomerase
MMAGLLRRPAGRTGLVHDITPEGAGWQYVGFALWRLAAGARAGGATGDREAVLVIAEGHVRLHAGGSALGRLGTRMSVFDWVPPAAVYLPPGTPWQAEAETAAALAVCTAPARGRYPLQVIGPEGISPLARGRGTNTRHIHPIAMEERDVAGSLLVTEVLTPSGHWSSWPAHRHDEDDFPRMTYLEETYWHRLNPPQGFGIQRVFTEDGGLDETMAVSDDDVVLVPRGHHPCAAPYGYDMYYLNVMAGPLRRWRFANHPDHDWIAKRDAG